MRYRAVLVAFFLVPTVGGVSNLLEALRAPTEVVCPGENVGENGEERPGPMRPGDTRCAVLDGSYSVASRTYAQQRLTQSLERRRAARDGALLLTFGAAGTLVSWRATRTPSPDRD
ncbi:hypothetical protein RM844_20910 [Streptomyces sp. DSM 44915]|uniref:Secreted protein n=1 Tax=Streptomyces chisholmiae TaxID=3075540 RepID=A0ABU2JUU5_9ACTN|nr:hypothetical protein [Streptomyces sp. DSM 44915]MDT0268751.1 hypothetical protein [Streptomyces sp. DSM 44915]